jgi:hypothetical protein
MIIIRLAFGVGSLTVILVVLGFVAWRRFLAGLQYKLPFLLPLN